MNKMFGRMVTILMVLGMTVTASPQDIDTEQLRKDILEAQRAQTPQDNAQDNAGAPQPIVIAPVQTESPASASVPATEFFGYDFLNNSQQFKIWDNIPVSDEYRLGPGDEIIITLWGDTESRRAYTVSKEGFIYIQPRVGNIQVASLSLSEAQKLLFKRLSSVYSTLGGSGGNKTHMDITLGKLKSINVSFVGEVQTPGMLAIHPMSTVLTGVIQSGGVKKSGSLRDIQVLRDGKKQASFDLYQYLKAGDKNAEIRLQDGDVVLVPPRHSSVTLLGEVNRPAIYEIMKDEKFKTLLQYAGGAKITAQSRVALRRIKPFSERENEDNLYSWTSIELNATSDFELIDGDLLKVRSVASEQQDVSISGPVLLPGDYPLTKDMKISDLLEIAGGVFSDQQWAKIYPYRADLVRIDPRTQTSEVVPIKLEELRAGDSRQDLTLKNGDALKIYPISATSFRKKVSIHGKVLNPGEYALDENMGLRDLILRAGGLDVETAYHIVELFRVEKTTLDEKYVSILKQEVSTAEFQNYLALDEFKLQHHDQVVVRRDPSVRYQENILITGEVTYPGIYILEPEVNSVEELIEAAGGLSPRAFDDGIQIKRGDQKVSWFSQRVELIPGDEIHVPRRPGTVRVSGAVNNPGLIEYRKFASLGDYLDAAGGLNSRADKGNIVVTYASGRSDRDGWLFHPGIEEGCEIMVHPEPESEPFRMTEFLKEIASISASLATIFFIVTR